MVYTLGSGLSTRLRSYNWWSMAALQAACARGISLAANIVIGPARKLLSGTFCPHYNTIKKQCL